MTPSGVGRYASSSETAIYIDIPYQFSFTKLDDDTKNIFLASAFS
jgi:hypothetical protein